MGQITKADMVIGNRCWGSFHLVLQTWQLGPIKEAESTYTLVTYSVKFNTETGKLELNSEL